MAKITDEASLSIRRWTTAGIIVVALAAATLSWSGLTALAEQAELGVLSPLFPVVVDVAMLVGALSALRSTTSGTSPRLGWFITLLALGVSVYGNMASFLEYVPAQLMVHALPPVMLAFVIELGFREIRHEIARPAAKARGRRKHQATPAAAAPVAGQTVATPAAAPAAAERDQVAVATASDGQPTLAMLRDRDAVLIEWIEREVAAGREVTGAAVVAAGLAGSDRTARRKLTALRNDAPQLFEPVATGQGSGGQVASGHVTDELATGHDSQDAVAKSWPRAAAN